MENTTKLLRELDWNCFASGVKDDITKSKKVSSMIIFLIFLVFEIGRKCSHFSKQIDFFDSVLSAIKIDK